MHGNRRLTRKVGFGLAHMVILAILAAPLAANTAGARPAPDSFADLVETLSPAVVNITVKQAAAPVAARPEFDTPELPDGSPFPEGSPFKEFFKRYFGQPGPDGAPPPNAPMRQGRGSGFIIDPQGYVVTNNHVIDGARDITVVLDDDTSWPATLIGRDPKTDLALLKVDAERPLPHVRFGDSDTARVGDWVLAIGNPFGLGGTVTAGIVSARARNLNAGPYDDFIQTDAPINRGNSGGPLFNLDGEVIGINTAIFSPSGGSVGIGFAVSSNLAAPILEQIRANGHVERGWLGVQIQSVTPDLAAGLGMDEPAGALVADVVGGGPAESAGLARGDVIIRFNGQAVADARALPRMVADTRAGKTVDVRVLRDGSERDIAVKIARLDEPGALAEAAPVAPDNGPLGLGLAKLTEERRQRYDIPDTVEGVLVTAVDPDGAGAKAGIRPGDVLVEVAQEAIDSPEDVITRIRDAEASGMKAVLMLINRSGDTIFTAATLAVS